MFPPSPTSQAKYLALGNLGAATKPGLDEQAWKPRLREKRLKDREEEGWGGGGGGSVFERVRVPIL